MPSERASSPLFGRAPGPILYVCALAAAAFLTVRSSDPAGSEADGLIAIVLLLCVVVWFVRLIAFVVRARKGTAASRGRWFILGPVLIGVYIALAATHAPVRLRWSWSRGDFQRALHSAPAASQVAGRAGVRLAVPRHLGWYDVAEADRYPWGTVFHNAGGDAAHWGGFAYLPEGVPTKHDEWGYLGLTSLGGGWYAWSDGF
jgi:hypothetical protein